MVTQCPSNQQALEGLKEGDLVLGVGIALNKTTSEPGFFTHPFTFSFKTLLPSPLPNVLITSSSSRTPLPCHDRISKPWRERIDQRPGNTPQHTNTL